MNNFGPKKIKLLKSGTHSGGAMVSTGLFKGPTGDQQRTNRGDQRLRTPKRGRRRSCKLARHARMMLTGHAQTIVEVHALDDRRGIVL